MHFLVSYIRAFFAFPAGKRSGRSSFLKYVGCKVRSDPASTLSEREIRKAPLPYFSAPLLPKAKDDPTRCRASSLGLRLYRSSPPRSWMVSFIPSFGWSESARRLDWVHRPSAQCANQECPESENHDVQERAVILDWGWRSVLRERPIPLPQDYLVGHIFPPGPLWLATPLHRLH